MRVRLTNALDEMAVRRGQLPGDAARACDVASELRPESVHTTVPPELVERLGLSLWRRWDGLPACGPVVFATAGVDTADEATVAGGPVRLGWCVLAKLGLVPGGRRETRADTPGKSG